MLFTDVFLAALRLPAPVACTLLLLLPPPGPSRFVPLFGMRQYKPGMERPAINFDEQVGVAGWVVAPLQN